ncbi:MAG: NAD-dependent epimerase/dehydratase family protein [Rhodothermaceae bacterium]|nr:NAD-dependent epimerase/dehydratase family protein [Rhodothermaceae bacterium]MXZ58817.1 NAD-dependent epimerase/dehydratase family protein [Rhodothermaceae bacterium]MYD67319.1 NAD-dependent epimerase/dehydratase family protein [Rhodothermaceae bacterium]MYH13151.1 NAD-dependent epimerase/dehydratase family protein [Rhodothermaceae bacterium]MYJ08031.1 NAD-dependent epimerase/dehydratase family protein [Rhodothermaceae bacterium]
MNVLVTGATGFLGSELVYQLLEVGYHIRIFRRETSKLDLLSPVVNDIEHVTGDDITDLEALRRAMKNVQVVFHVAGNVKFGSRSLNHVNVRGTAAVVDAARETGIERLVHTSSVAAIGTSEGVISDENAEWQDKPWPYAQSKHMAELEVQRSIAEGLDAVIVNPSLILGPDRSGGKALNLTHDYALKIRAGRAWLYPTGGTNVVDVADVAAGHLAALEHGQTGVRYILGSENLSWKSIISTLAEALGVKPPRIPLPYNLALVGGGFIDLLSFMMGRRSPLGRSTVTYALKTREYSNTRAISELGCSFRPFSETAQRVADSLKR